MCCQKNKFLVEKKWLSKSYVLPPPPAPIENHKALEQRPGSQLKKSSEKKIALPRTGGYPPVIIAMAGKYAI